MSNILLWQISACKHDVCDGVGLAALALCREGDANLRKQSFDSIYRYIDIRIIRPEWPLSVFQ